MKSTEKQVKDDTKRLLRNENCSTCIHRWFLDAKWHCSTTNSLVPLVHTCYQYERKGSYLWDTVLKRD